MSRRREGGEPARESQRVRLLARVGEERVLEQRLCNMSRTCRARVLDMAGARFRRSASSATVCAPCAASISPPRCESRRGMEARRAATTGGAASYVRISVTYVASSAAGSTRPPRRSTRPAAPATRRQRPPARRARPTGGRLRGRGQTRRRGREAAAAPARPPPARRGQRCLGSECLGSVVWSAESGWSPSFPIRAQ